jgi:hypothetical protein
MSDEAFIGRAWRAYVIGGFVSLNNLDNLQKAPEMISDCLELVQCTLSVKYLFIGSQSLLPT